MRLSARLALAVVSTVALSACRDEPTTPLADGRRLVPNARVLPAVFGPLDNPELVLRSTVAGGPFGVAVSSRGAVYVTLTGTGQVAAGAVEPPTMRAGTIAVGSVPTDVAFSPTGERAYVSNQYDRTIGVIDVATGTQVKAIAVPDAPYKLFMSPDGRRLYSGGNRSSVFVIDTESEQLIGTVGVGDSPNGFALHPNRRLLYVSSFWEGTISEIDLDTSAEVRRFVFAGVPQGMEVSTNGAELYVANEKGSLDVWSLATGTRTGVVPLVSGGFGLEVALSPDDAFAYVSLPHAGVVQVVRLSTRTVVKTLELGGTPRRVAFDTRTGTTVVANGWGWVDFLQSPVPAGNTPPTLVNLRADPAAGPYSIAARSCGGRYTACVRFRVSDADGAADAPFRTVVDWGDGTAWRPNTVPADTPLLAPHDYARPGTYTVTVTATDQRGTSRTANLTLVVVR